MACLIINNTSKCKQKEIAFCQFWDLNSQPSAQIFCLKTDQALDNTFELPCGAVLADTGLELK